MSKGVFVFLVFLFLSPLRAQDNLIRNGDFETGDTFPFFWGSRVKVYPGIKVLPSDPRYGGKIREGINILWVKEGKGKCVLFLMDEPAPPYRSISETTGITLSSEMITLKPGKRYLLSVKAKSSGPEGIVFIKAYRKKDEGDFQERFRAPLQLHFRGKYNRWHRFSRTFKIPFPDTRFVIVSLYAYGKRGRIWFDEVSLKEKAPDL